MKKILGMILLLGMLFSVGTVYAAKDIAVYVDGEKIAFDQAPFIKDGRTLVPLRAIFEALGCRVDYLADVKMVHAKRGTQYTLSLTIGEAELYKNGKIMTMDVPAMIVGGRTFVPLRAVSEALDTKVAWDGEARKVTVDNTVGYGIKTKYLEKNYLASDGTVLIQYFYGYPVLPNPDNSAIITKLNHSFAQRAVLHQTAMEKENLSAAEENYAQSVADGLPWYAYACEHSFDITYDKNPVLCIKETDYSFYDGAHPNTNTDAYVYNLQTGALLSMSDVFVGTEEEVQKLLLAEFSEWCDMYALEDDVKAAIEENMNQACFYLTEDGVVVYFDAYTVGPYALGEPEITIPYKFNEKLFQSWVTEDAPNRQIP